MQIKPNSLCSYIPELLPSPPHLQVPLARLPQGRIPLTPSHLQVPLARLPQGCVQLEVGHPLGDDAVQLLLALRGEARLINLVLKALLTDDGEGYRR